MFMRSSRSKGNSDIMLNTLYVAYFLIKNRFARRDAFFVAVFILLPFYVFIYLFILIFANCNFSSLTCIFGQTNDKNPKDLKKVKIMIKCTNCSGTMCCSSWDVTRTGTGWG